MRKHLMYMAGLAMVACIAISIIYIFRDASAITFTSTLRPNGDVTSGWTTGGTSNLGTCTTHCDYVDEALNGSDNGDGDGSYVDTANNAVEEFAMGDPTTSGQRATSVKVRIYYTLGGNSILATNTLTLNLRVNGTLQTAVSPPNNPGGAVNTYAWYETTYNAPGTGWTRAEIDTLQVYLKQVNNILGDTFKVSTVETVVTWASPSLSEDASRTYLNNNSTTPGTPVAATNTAGEIHNNSAFRMRLGITPTSVNWLTGSWGGHGNTYNLQFAKKTAASCAAQATGWANVQSGSGNIRWYDNPGVADGAAIGSYANDPTTSGTKSYQTYKESNNFTIASTVTAGNTALWDFSLQDVGSTPGDVYCFKLMKSDGAALEGYSAYPEVTMVGDYGTTIVDGTGAEVASPQVSFPSTQVKTSCQTTTATLGLTSQKLRIENNLVKNGWDVSIAATAGPTALWAAGANRYDFNDASGSPAGCLDGGDGDSYPGQLRVNPAVASVTSKPGCTTTGLSWGTDAKFVEGSINAISIGSANSTSSRFCYWDITGVALEQKIPAGTPSGSYTIDMTVTMTAL